LYLCTNKTSAKHIKYQKHLHMKKLALFLIILMATIKLSAQFEYLVRFPIDKKQVLEPIELKITYTLHYIFDTAKKEIVEDIQALEIGKNHAKFYSVLRAKQDSIFTFPHLYGFSPTRSIPGTAGLKSNQRRLCDPVFWNYPERGSLFTINYFFNTEYAYSETVPRIVWQIEENMQTVLGYSAHKATARFRGRDWVVWFAPELPTSLGPWKLSGLPGLIVKAETINNLDGGYFKYTMIGIEKPKPQQFIYTYDKPMKKITRQEFRRLRKRQLEDPISVSLEHGGPTTEFVWRDGKPTEETRPVVPGTRRGFYRPMWWMELE